MGFLVGLNMFRPVLKSASRMSAPVNELKVAGAGLGKAEKTVGDIAELSAKAKPSGTEKLFSSFEEFKENALKRLEEYRGFVPEKVYAEAEKSIKNHEFELTKSITNYYSKLKDCKTMEEVAAIYPEFSHLNIDIMNELRTAIKSSIPERVCKEAMKLPTKEERLQYIIKYMEQNTNKCVKEWDSYPDILRIQRETAVEIANGLFSGSTDTQAGLKFFANKEPLRFYLTDKKDRDKVIISYLKQYYLEGKSLLNILPETAKGRVITPECINYRGFRLSNPSYANFRSVTTTLEKEAGEYKAISQLTSGEVSSAIMKRAWSTSALRKDMADVTRFGKGWTNVKSILNKRKGIENDLSSSDKMITRYLLNRFKTRNLSVEEKNPFLKFENPDVNKTDKVKRFVNGMYHANEQTMSDRMILKSKEFQEFKSKFDTEGMKESIQKIEDQYINIFFKYFWTDIRKERFANALKEANGVARENIKINDELLMQALKESAV